MGFIRNGIPMKRAKTFEPSNQEAVCLEVTITKRKWITYAFYRSESYSKLDVFLEEFKKSVDKAINKYENIILIGDINVDMSDRNTTGADYADVSEFCDIFSLKNLIKDDTCFSPIAKHSSLIDIILTNRSHSFQNSVAMEIGISDHHKMIVTVMKSHIAHHIVRLQPYKIQYRIYQGFSPDAFVNDLIHADLGAALHYSKDANVVYNDFCSRFRKVLDRHASLKSKFIRGNQAPFMTKELSKGIMTRSKLKNKFNRHKTKANWTAYKIQRNKCVQLRKTAVKNHFLKITENGKVNNKSFWRTIKPLLSFKGTHDNHDIIREENRNLIKDNKELSEIFNNFYVNIVESTTGKKPMASNPPSNCSHDEELDHIIRQFNNHPSILKIKEKHPCPSVFSLSNATEDDILRILLSLDITKGAGYDTLPPKVIKLAADIIAKPLSEIINFSKFNCLFPDMQKFATVTPAFKKEDCSFKGNYRPISILNTFSKVFERFLLEKITPFFNGRMADFFSAYRKNTGCQNVLLRLVEQWRKSLDNNKVAGTVLMDLSKAFDCLPHNLLIAKLAAYGLDRNALKLIASYLKDRKQAVNIKGYIRVFKLIISGVP